MKDRKTILSTLLGLLSGGANILFGSCAIACTAGGAALCATPLLSLSGFTAAGLTSVSWLKYLLIPLSFLFFGIAFYRQYHKPACDANNADCNCKPKQNKMNMKSTLWVVFLISLSLMSWTMFKGNVSRVVPSGTDTTKCKKECSHPCIGKKDSTVLKKADKAKPRVKE